MNINFQAKKSSGQSNGSYATVNVSKVWLGEHVNLEPLRSKSKLWLLSQVHYHAKHLIQCFAGLEESFWSSWVADGIQWHRQPVTGHSDFIELQPILYAVIKMQILQICWQYTNAFKWKSIWMHWCTASSYNLKHSGPFFVYTSEANPACCFPVLQNNSLWTNIHCWVLLGYNKLCQIMIK